jgi:hypothetical protein
MFKKGDLVKLISKVCDSWGSPIFVVWYLVTKDSQDGWCDGVVVNFTCCRKNSRFMYLAKEYSLGDIHNRSDDDLVLENDLSLMVVSKYDL